MGVQRVFFTCVFSFTAVAVHAQVIIRDTIRINPKTSSKLPRIPESGAANTQALLRYGTTGYYEYVETTVPGVNVTASIAAPVANLPDNTAYEVYLGLPSGTFKVVKKVNGCGGTPGEEALPFPSVIPSCGRITASTTSWTPWYAICLSHPGGGTVTVSGNTAIFVLSGSLFWTSYQVTITLSASLAADYQPQVIETDPQPPALGCNSSSAVHVSLLNGRNEPYILCGNAGLSGTATITNTKPYVFLSSGSQQGSSVTFPVQSGQGAFLVNLDTSKGIIPHGADIANISVNVEGIQKTISVPLTCNYPQPTVAIINPASDTSITLTSSTLPLLTFSEHHWPQSGSQFEPSISWEPGPTLETASYYDSMGDSVVVNVKVTADNPGGTATDERKITLRKGCGITPPRYRQADSLWARDIYDNTNSTISAIGCALSCMAMVMTAFGDTVTPGELNAWMKERKTDDGGFSSSSVNWRAMEKHSSSSMSVDYFGNEAPLEVGRNVDLAQLDSNLDNCSLVIAQVYNSQTGHQHWVVIVKRANGKYSILDPGRGETMLDGYENNIWSYLVVNKQ